MRVSDDVNHKKAQTFLKTIRKDKLRLHTTNFVLDEVYTYFCRVHEIAVEMAKLIMDNPLIALHRVSVDDEDKAWEILNDFSVKIKYVLQGNRKNKGSRNNCC